MLVLDFGGQYAHLIARRVRECRVYSELIAHDTPLDEIVARRPLGIILSGGPSSVYEAGAPALDPGVLGLGIPVLGICYGMQAMALALGGEVGGPARPSSARRRSRRSPTRCCSASWRSSRAAG